MFRRICETIFSRRTFLGQKPCEKSRSGQNGRLRANFFRPGVERLDERILPSGAPAAPMFTAAAASASQINLVWNAVYGASGYLVDEWTGSAWIQVANLGSGSTSIAINGLSAGTTYYFDLAAYNVWGTSWAPYQGATTFASLAPPAAPSFTASAVSSTQINLAWNAVSGANGYVVDELINGAWTQISSLGSGSTSIAINGLSAGTTYYFDLAASNAAGTSWASAQGATTLKQTAVTNPIWSGYVIDPGSSVNVIGGSWVLPAASSTGANSITSIWLGIDGYGGSTVEQIGVTWSPSTGYYAWVEFYGDARGQSLGKYYYETTLNSIIGSSYFSPQAGDTISARVAYVSSSSTTSTFSFYFEDAPRNGISKNWQESLTTTYVVPARSSGEWIVESPDGGAYPLANFGTVAFSGAWATVGTTTGPITAFANIALNMAPSGINGGGTDSTSSLTNSSTPGPWEFTGLSSSFTVSFVSAHADTATNGSTDTLRSAIESTQDDATADAIWADSLDEWLWPMR
jgi:hypothetical protein